MNTTEHAEGRKAYDHVVQQLLLDHMRAGGEAVFLVVSNSMRPLVHQGDEVMVERISSADLRCGDMVTLWNGKGYWTHRFLGWRMRGNTRVLITKGDACYTADPPVSPDQVIGKVAALQRKGRRLHSHRWPYAPFHALIGLLSRVQASVPRGNALNNRGLIVLFDRIVYLLLRGISGLLRRGFVEIETSKAT